ncbi:hypothetical protein Nepgr_026006 [Nepenthes gracilis]|uniref:Uncharacterized protein n=1 Tax=Nepenthes gracilis TaxID=150966 RepID=A0AAD3Y074_NEPGR|nr:hypothetical protein Nepgr_026006 [Nepenthes gracilis]
MEHQSAAQSHPPTSPDGSNPACVDCTTKGDDNENPVKLGLVDYLGPQMSDEELRIRSQLEEEVEKDLEEEIKQGIYALGLRLHRLYRQQKQRNIAKLLSKGKTSTKNKSVSEVNISIKMEGATEVKIKEITKEAVGKRSMMSDAVAENKGGLHAKKFNWANSLRS